MVEEYMKHLAAAIVTESQIVSYRLLSRELKVHHNVAKRMLFEFHRQQNAKKAGSVHATYLITGIQALAPAPKVAANGDDDVPMPNSPFMSSPAARQSQVESEPVKQKVLTMVKEENLEAAKVKYESISSIHVYSLEPSTIQNMEALSTITQKIMTDYISENPLIHNKIYGIIQNPHVKRRTGARPPPAPLPVKQENKSAFAKSKDPKASNETKTLTKSKEAPPDSGEQATKVAAPSLLKRESSDLFKSFAKAKPKSKPEAAATKQKASDDVPMKDIPSDSEDNDDDGIDADLLAESKPESAARRQARAEQAEKLRKLAEGSDEEDETMPDAGVEKPDSEAEEDEEVAEAEEEPDVEPTKEEEEEPEPEPEPTVTVANGRRRGRRKVMKKKTTRDGEGFLVTREEAAWESFSEDDTPASQGSREKNPFASSAGAGKGAKKAAGTGGAGSGAGAGKPGQGNIMSFFGKK